MVPRSDALHQVDDLHFKKINMLVTLALFLEERISRIPMPIIKCALCSYRNPDGREICGNCGQPLTAFSSTTEAYSSDTLPLLQGYMGAKSSREIALPLILPQAEYDPYGTVLPDLVDDPSKNPLLAPSAEASVPGADTIREKLPWGYPRRQPDIEGVIIYTQADQEIPDYPSPLLAIGGMLLSGLWTVPGQDRQREYERTLVTMLRIRTLSGEKRDARLVGYLRGANLSLGDSVSLWGWKRRGSLMIRLGYNHTTRAKIITRATSATQSSLAILLTFCAALGVLIYWSLASNFWTPLFSLFKKP